MIQTAAALLSAALVAFPAAARKDAPSRPAQKGCRWTKVSDPAAGLAAWAEQCDFGYRRIDVSLKGTTLVARYSDGGEPEPLVDVLDLKPGETPEAGVRRLFAERTDPKVAARCVMAPYRGTKPRAGAKRLTFVPDAALRKELDATQSPDEVPDPPCGDWGDAPDGIQYWEIQPASGARKVLFVRVGQDEPLFDEETLRLLPPR